MTWFKSISHNITNNLVEGAETLRFAIEVLGEKEGKALIKAYQAGQLSSEQWQSFAEKIIEKKNAVSEEFTMVMNFLHETLSAIPGGFQGALAKEGLTDQEKVWLTAIKDKKYDSLKDLSTKDLLILRSKIEEPETPQCKPLNQADADPNKDYMEFKKVQTGSKGARTRQKDGRWVTEGNTLFRVNRQPLTPQPVSLAEATQTENPAFISENPSLIDQNSDWNFDLYCVYPIEIMNGGNQLPAPEEMLGYSAEFFRQNPSQAKGIPAEVVAVDNREESVPGFSSASGSIYDPAIRQVGSQTIENGLFYTISEDQTTLVGDQATLAGIAKYQEAAAKQTAEKPIIDLFTAVNQRPGGKLDWYLRRFNPLFWFERLTDYAEAKEIGRMDYDESVAFMKKNPKVVQKKIASLQAWLDEYLKTYPNPQLREQLQGIKFKVIGPAELIQNFGYEDKETVYFVDPAEGVVFAAPLAVGILMAQDPDHVLDRMNLSVWSHEWNHRYIYSFANDVTMQTGATVGLTEAMLKKDWDKDPNTWPQAMAILGIAGSNILEGYPSLEIPDTIAQAINVHLSAKTDGEMLKFEEGWEWALSYYEYQWNMWANTDLSVPKLLEAAQPYMNFALSAAADRGLIYEQDPDTQILLDLFKKDIEYRIEALKQKAEGNFELWQQSLGGKWNLEHQSQAWESIQRLSKGKYGDAKEWKNSAAGQWLLP